MSTNLMAKKDKVPFIQKSSYGAGHLVLNLLIVHLAFLCFFY